MAAKLEKIENCEAYFEFVVDADDMEQGLEQSYKKVVKKIDIPGFRKGAAPRAVVESNIGLEGLLEEALDIVVPDKYYAALKELELQPIGDPDIEVGYVVKGEPVTVKVIVPLYPQVKLGKLEGLEVKVPLVPPVTDDDVERSLQESRAKNKIVTDKFDAPAVMGDTVTIDFKGSVEETPFEGEQDHKVLIGADNFIPGFEEQLIGLKQGDKREIRINFAEDHPSQMLAGKVGIFDVEVKKVEYIEERLLDDQFAQEVAHLANMDELRAEVRKVLEANAARRQHGYIHQAVTTAAVEASEVSVPEFLVMETATSMMQQLMQELEAEGGSIELYAQMIGKTVDEIKKQFWVDSKTSVKVTYLLYKMVEEMNFDVTEDEIEEGMLNFAKMYNMDFADMNELKEKLGPMVNNITLELKSQKAADYLIEHAVITKVDRKELAEEAKKETEESKLN